MSDRTEVVDREREFHNTRFGQEVDPRAHLDKWYQTIRHGAAHQDRIVVAKSRGADVLEYGCAGGELSVEYLDLPATARTLSGIDISDVAIAKANAFAAAQGYTNTRFLAMDAERMDFPDASFDLVFGRGIIHHLDLDRCFAEIRRVLKPGGVAVFYEPLGHNPVLNAYRNRTPDIRTPDEHPLLMSDFTLARTYFSKTTVECFGLLSLVSGITPSPLRSFAYSAGVAADAVLLRLPGINRYAWYALISLQK